MPLSATHHGVAGPATSPHALTRFVSGVVPVTPLFETSGVTVKLFPPAAPAAPAADASTSATAASATAARV